MCANTIHFKLIYINDKAVRLRFIILLIAYRVV